jgi:hypothetical protein
MSRDSEYAALIKRLGFVADPFAKTNADEEERLDSYFIQPPFYGTVFGDPKSPKSTVVFAPRGGGKTALKRKIEIASQHSTFLCVTYNTFPVDKLMLKDISPEYHLRNLVRLILIGVISECSTRGMQDLNKDDRHFLYLFSKTYFSKIDRKDLKEAIGAVKNLSDKAQEWWNKFLGPIGLAVNVLLSKLGIDAAEIKKFDREGGSLGAYREQLQMMREIANKLGRSSIYILIDRVDELSITGTGSSSFDFIAPLLTDLHLLESAGYAFKFFLWDMLLEGYRLHARPDRIKYHTLSWTHAQLRNMISERLKAYSQGRVASLAQLVGLEHGSVDHVIISYALGSPRTIIRICKEILDQQNELNPSAATLSVPAVYRGIEVFANNFANESIDGSVLRELKKLRQVNFTVKHVYASVFKFSPQAGIAKVKQWQDGGIVQRIASIKETKGSKPSNLYGLSNPLVGKHIFPDLSAFEFWDKKLRVCPGCDALLIRDWDERPESVCHRCDLDLLEAELQ